MKLMLLNGYELATVLLPGILALLFLRVCYRRRGLSMGKGHTALLLVFALYLAAVFYFTGSGTLHDLLRRGLELRRETINLIPFSNTIDWQGYILNILLFVPFGLLLPLLWPGAKRLWATALWGLGFSALIEASQLLNNRATDVDDLLMNTLGAVAGWCVYRLVAALLKGKGRPGQAGKRPGWEPAFFIAMLFLGHFLLFDVMGMAKWLYGF